MEKYELQLLLLGSEPGFRTLRWQELQPMLQRTSDPAKQVLFRKWKSPIRTDGYHWDEQPLV